MNVSSVKNLNGETFSAVQDTFLTDIVSSNSANWNEISAYQANSGSFLTAVPAGTMNESAFGYDENDKISGYNGSAFAGGDVPEGVMVESGLEYNAVNEISGYNGSAIAQYGAEKQWLVHDDTLVHAANSAQYALGVNLSAVAQLLGVDETVLFEGSAGKGTIFQLNESISAFNKITITLNTNDGECYFSNYFNTNLCSANNWYCTLGLNDSYSRYYKAYRVNISGNSACLTGTFEKDLASTSNTGTTALVGYIREIVGIGRKS